MFIDVDKTGNCFWFELCGNEGQWMVDPFIHEIYGEEEWMFMCFDCLCDRSDQR